jgi:hypothetical protein
MTFLVLLASLCTTPALTNPNRESQGSNSLLLQLTQRSNPFTLVATLVNAGPQALVLNVGMMLGNGRGQFPNEIHFWLTTPKRKRLTLMPRRGGIIGGRIDPMIIPLPSGATYSIKLDLADYWAPEDRTWRWALHPGSYTLTGRYIGRGVPVGTTNLDMRGIALMSYWTGTIDSNILKFTVN